MIYIYDILLNFQKNAYEYYEWKREDSITHIKRIKLFKISSPQMEDLYSHEIEVPSSFLELISHTTELYRKQDIEYASLFTDGYRVLGLMFNKNGKSILRSKLLLEEEEEILEISIRLKEAIIPYKNKSKKEHILLTRKEQVEVKLLKDKLSNLYKNKKIDVLKYLYLEYFGTIEEDIKKMYYDLKNSLSSYSKEHKKLLEVLELSKKRQV